MASEPTEGQGPMLEGSGPAWPPAPDPVPPAPAWINARAFPGAWRDTLGFTVGALHPDVAKEFPGTRPWKPWNHRPEPGSNGDVDQAIAAKVHIGLRVLPLLAEATLTVIEPQYVEALPQWSSDEEPFIYAAEAQLPADPLFLDFESTSGRPAMWTAETWPLPFHLRGAVCWQRDDLLSIVPYGAVGGVHPWGGTDYQAWARWVIVQGGHGSDWPAPGPGDFFTRASGEVLSWVDGESDSVCTQQGSVAFNLCHRVLGVLMLAEALGAKLVEPRVSRPVMRRAKREKKRIALELSGLPSAPHSPPGAIQSTADSLRAEAQPQPSSVRAPCPIPKTHARLHQAHALWHEALEDYEDPDAFVVRLNALLQALRTVTWVLRKEACKQPWFETWYACAERRMGGDQRMRWALEARNELEKEGDLDTHSVARVSVAGERISGRAVEMNVDPSTTPHEIVRLVRAAGLPAEVRDEGVLVVERRWTVEALAGEEILDALAHC